YSPAYAVINRLQDVLYFSAGLERYFSPVEGDPSTKRNIVEMARKSMQRDLRAAIHQAIRYEKTVTKDKVEVRDNGSSHFVRLMVEPWETSLVEETLYLVVLEKIDEAVSELALSLKGEVQESEV